MPETLEQRIVLSLAPTISISDATPQDEGDSGTTSFDFQVSLSEASSDTVTVHMAASDGSATLDDGDYVALGTIRQEKNGFLMIEAEHYTNRYTRGNCEWLQVPEEDGGTPRLYSNFRGSYMQSRPGCGNPGNNPPVFTAQPGSLEFEFFIGTPGQYQLYMSWDGFDESSDGVFAMMPQLSDGIGGTHADWWTFAGNDHFDTDFATERWDGTGEAEDFTGGDDAGDPAVWQIDDPGIYTLRFNHRQNGVSVDGFVFQLASLPAPSDPQESPLGGILTFNPGQTSQTVTVDVVGDGKPEPDERFFVDLSNATGGSATIAKAQGVGTITNDDFLSINSATVVEGDSGTVDANLTVTLFEPFSTPVTVDYTTAEWIADSNDFIPQSGTVTFDPGQTSKPLTIKVNGDTGPEVDETFFVNLSNSSGGTSLVGGPGIGVGQGVVAITNDDGTAIRWTGNGNGTSWTDRLNWDLFRVPDATDDLVIIDDVVTTTLVDVVGNRTIKRMASQEPLRIFGGTFTLTEGTSVVGDITISRENRTSGNLMINGDRLFGADVIHFNGNVDGPGDLIATGTYTFNDGAMRGSGTTFTNGGMVIDTTLGLTLDARTLETSGTSSWRTGNISIGGGSTLHNLGSFDVMGDQDINTGSGAGAVVNDGTFAKISGAGSTQVNRSFTNNGTVAARSGVLDLQSGFTNYTSADSTLTGGTYEVSATLEWNAADVMTNAATIVLDGPSSMIRNGSNALANLASNTTAGSLTIQNGHNLTTPSFTNAGSVTVGGSSTLSVTGDYTQTAGTTELQLGTLNATSAVNIQGGALTGAGTVGGNVSNAGKVSPGSSVGILNISGNYTQTASGSLDVELGAGGESDQLNATGTATLGGTLNVSTLGGFIPNRGEQFQTMTFASRSGDFAVKNADLGGGLVADTVYEPTRMLLTINDAAPSATVTGTVLNGGQANRSGIGSFVMQFSDTVTVSGAGALVLRNHTTGSAVSISGATITGNGTNAITWDLSGVALAPGYYTATLPKSEGLAATHSELFSVQPGDSDGDGAVGFSDFGQLASNFNATGVPYIPGDMDGDGAVGFGDFGILASNFNAALVAPSQDTGDAGGSYPAAQHLIGSGLSLGANISGANDGVTFGTLQAGNSAATLTVNATIPAGSGAIVNAFIDFNNDGDWSDSGEQILVDQALSNGDNSLTVPIPAGASVGTAQARFRVSSVAGYGPGGLAVNGEVEDYAVTITGSSRSAGRGIPGSTLDFWNGTVAEGTGATAKSGPTFSSVKPIRTDVVDQAIDALVAQSADVFDILEHDSTANEELVDSALQEADDLLHDVL